MKPKPIIPALLIAALTLSSTASADLAEVRSITKDAYIYGYPVVANYRFLYARGIDTADGMHVAPSNTFGHDQDVKKAGEKAVQTVNADTPYSRAIIDLRSEPIVLSLPKIGKNRYYVMQFVDMYLHNFAYVGSRTTGNNGGTFLITGPGWKGKAPKGITRVIPCETELMTLVGRTQIFGPNDLPNVKRIQDKESNWLPAPKGPFFAVLRMYWPKPEALDGSWKQPPLVKVQ